MKNHEPFSYEPRVINQPSAVPPGFREAQNQPVPTFQQSHHYRECCSASQKLGSRRNVVSVKLQVACTSGQAHLNEPTRPENVNHGFQGKGLEMTEMISESARAVATTCDFDTLLTVEEDGEADLEGLEAHLAGYHTTITFLYHSLAPIRRPFPLWQKPTG